jgi:hypothetical protein
LNNLSTLKISFGARAVGAEAGVASPYGSGSTKMMQLLEASAPDPQHWFKHVFKNFDNFLIYNYGR